MAMEAINDISETTMRMITMYVGIMATSCFRSNCPGIIPSSLTSSTAPSLATRYVACIDAEETVTRSTIEELTAGATPRKERTILATANGPVKVKVDTA